MRPSQNCATATTSRGRGALRTRCSTGTPDAHPSTIKVSPDVLDRDASARTACDRLDGPVDCSQEGEAKALATVLEPGCGVSEIVVRLAYEADRGRLPARSSAIRCRTDSQGSVWDSPVMAVTARRSISWAHARRIVSASSPADSSRLAKRQAASADRSPSESASASRRRSSAFVATQPTVLPGSPPSLAGSRPALPHGHRPRRDAS